MKCNKCGKENIAGSKFCCECGSKLARLCPQCQHPIAENIKFCPECGANLLGQAQTSAIMKDNVVAGDVNQTVNASYVTNIYNPVDSSPAELECCSCHVYIPRSRKQESTCTGCGRLFCDKHMENRVCRTCRQAQKLSPYIYEKLTGGKYIIKGVKNRLPAHIIIPEAVETIDTRAFENANIFEVTLPEGLVRIGARAFANCKYLEKINFPQSLKLIEAEAFLNCKSLELAPPQHARVNATAFNGTYHQAKQEAQRRTDEAQKKQICQERLAETRRAMETAEFSFEVERVEGKTISILKKVTKIKNSHVIIPQYDLQGNPVTIIGEESFIRCTQLKGITIPDSITSIRESAFLRCTDLINVQFGKGLTTIEANAFLNCEKLQNITIPDSVTHIKSGAFGGCINLSKIKFGKSLTDIGAFAFQYCYGLQSITIPDSVICVNENAFNCCRNLTKVILGKSLTSIGKEAFHWCEKLQSITIPDSVTHINAQAFGHCSGLTEVKLGKGLTSIGTGVFYYCNHLPYITIPDCIKHIDNSGFHSCYGLQRIHFQGTSAAWNAIAFGEAWHTGVPATEVICTDGTVPLK